MANRKKKTGIESVNDNTIVINDVKAFGEHLNKVTSELQGRSFEIVSATIKDDFCKYGYTVTSGVQRGFTHKVDGTGIIHKDMQDAFARLNVHLAVIDDVYLHSGIDITDVDTLHGHDLTILFNVVGFSITGEEGNESVVLMGSKYVSQSIGRIELKTPKIPLDDMSSYKWHNELKAALEVSREEVALYSEGKFIPAKDEEQDSPDQPALEFEVEKEESEEFETGK